MSKIKIETITPVHIGSGEFLQYNTDFVVDKVEDDIRLYVIDPNKIFQLIGVEHLNDWILSIERKEDTKAFVKRYAKNVTPEDYSSRVIGSYTVIHSGESLKSCIHDGMGVPYIPGSSIKGAIRTAVLSSLVANVNNAENKIKDFKGKVSAKVIEEELFGKDPNSDVFRFIQVGDAYFKKECEVATKMINLNIRESSNELKDKNKPQVVETIEFGNESSFQMKISKDYFQFVKSKWNGKNALGNFPEELRDISSLFLLINTHTKSLLMDEIEYWNHLLEEGYIGADHYVQEMQNILDELESCKKGKECVLRIGHASGWRFITGGWAENLENFKNVVIPASRPGNDKKYKDYDFPKSRRLDADSYVLGFVKLSIV